MDTETQLPMDTENLAETETLSSAELKIPPADSGQVPPDSAPAGDHLSDTATPEQTEQDVPAHYEVSVQHYAQYDKVDSGYSKETQQSLQYAGKSPFSRFFSDLFMILTRPGAFWKAQDEHPATISQLYWPHLTILVVLRTIAVMMGSILQYAVNKVHLMQLLIEAVVQGLMIFLLIGLLSLIISGISTLSGSGFHYERAQRFVGFMLTPILFVGVLSFLPFPYMGTICDLIAMPWAFLVLGAGILPYLRIKPEQGPTMTGLFCGLLLCLWGLIPMLIPHLVGLLIR